MRKTLFAAGLMFAGFTSFAVPAMADVDVDVNLGFPGPGYNYYDYRVGPDWRFRDGYGWYRPVPRPGYGVGRLSCGEARRIVRQSGYRNVAARNCSGRTYTFLATRNGRNVVIYVNSRNGRIWRG
jgi:hypothetical protein